MNKTYYKYFVIYKPFGMLSQFSKTDDKPVLSDLMNFPKDVYPVGRLDADSEGLLIVTNDNKLKTHLLNPVNHYNKNYLVQIENEITNQALNQLQSGVLIKVNKSIYKTKPAKVTKLQSTPDLPDRYPPIRIRKNIPTSWIELSIIEGKNRQIRKMTAATGFPTLRLVRISIEKLSLQNFKPGEVKEFNKENIYKLLNIC